MIEREQNMEGLESLCRKLGYQFDSMKLLENALSHRSAKGESNERLEFLGDSILNFVIAAKLYDSFPQLNEGELSRVRASLVKGETLALLAKEFNLSEYLRLGIGELKSGGAHRSSIQADAVEAIIGAIYIEAGFETCREMILSWFTSRLNNVNLVSAKKDPKTQLQEALQARKLALPDYDVVAIKGEAHAQEFHVRCKVTSLKFETIGIGTSRRKAEQRAAKEYLKNLS